MARLKKKLIVVGDRLLVRPEEGEERTHAGLYLPQTATAARQAGGGWVVSVGPGVPVVNPLDMSDEP
jgi:chaperonin GroES